MNDIEIWVRLKYLPVQNTNEYLDSLPKEVQSQLLIAFTSGKMSYLIDRITPTVQRDLIKYILSPPEKDAIDILIDLLVRHYTNHGQPE